MAGQQTYPTIHNTKRAASTASTAPKASPPTDKTPPRTAPVAHLVNKHRQRTLSGILLWKSLRHCLRIHLWSEEPENAHLSSVASILAESE